MTIFEHWKWTVRLPCLLAATLGLAVSSQTVEAATVAELHRVAAEPTAALRDAQHRTDVRVTIWHPAAPEAIERPIGIGPADRPLFEVGSAAPNAPFGPGAQSYPTVLLSHGFGGTARSVGWFGIALARAGFMVVSVNHPGNNSVDPMTASSTLLPWDRVADLRAALAAVEADPVTGPHIDLERLGVAGFSAGGFTALVAAGAQVNWDHLQTFCSSNPEDGVCMPQREFPSLSATDVASAKADPAVQAEIGRAASDHAIPGVRAAFVLAPPLVQALDPASLLKVPVPTEIVLGDADRVAPPGTNGFFAGERIPGAKIVVLPGVGHYDFIATCTAAGVAVSPLCTNSVPQSATHEQAVTAAVAFFERSLGPPRQRSAPDQTGGRDGAATANVAAVRSRSSEPAQGQAPPTVARPIGAPMTKLTPFADDAASISIGELTVENGTDQVSLYGSLDITRDKQGLAHARCLKALVEQAVQLLGAQSDLPDALPAAKPKTVANPFS